MNDPTHRERFWHPPVPPLSADQLRTHYICNECGIATTSLPDLQVRHDTLSAISPSPPPPFPSFDIITNQSHLHFVVQLFSFI